MDKQASLSLRETANRLLVTRQTVLNWINTGRLPADRQLDGTWAIPADAVEAAEAERREIFDNAIALIGAESHLWEWGKARLAKAEKDLSAECSAFVDGERDIARLATAIEAYKVAELVIASARTLHVEATAAVESEDQRIADAVKSLHERRAALPGRTSKDPKDQ